MRVFFYLKISLASKLIFCACVCALIILSYLKISALIKCFGRTEYANLDMKIKRKEKSEWGGTKTMSHRTYTPFKEIIIVQ